MLCVGYYWPTIQQDSIDCVKKCIPCKQHDNLIHTTLKILHSIVSPWLFVIWC
uniref:Integrase zinc-binding domain-containing protein n=1 Tax=Cajanus cajan TaxID=3821 RepID=A0A151SFV7_CAJCA|nr:hypothetical protein KK1_024485 [Cajanus cajan]